MLLDESNGYSAFDAQSEAVCDFAMPEAKRILLPAQEWELATKAYCGDRLSEADPGDVVTVKEFEHAGFLYAVFACSYGGYSGEYWVDAWQLLPATSFSGITTGVIDSSEYGGSRARGDMTGLVVNVRRRKMVCSKPVHFIRQLPTVRPLPIAQAIDFDNSSQKAGWRAFRYKHPAVTWAEFAGHPVAVYAETDEHQEMRVLYWKSMGTIHEYFLSKDHPISLLDTQSQPQDNSEQLDEPRHEQPFQVSLF